MLPAVGGLADGPKPGPAEGRQRGRARASMMTAAVFAGFVAALVAPWLVRLIRDRAGWALALVPAGIALYFFTRLPVVARGDAALARASWIPTLGLAFDFRLDGLGLLFGLIIAGIGAIVLVYAGPYLQGHRDFGRFAATMLAFMASMLGLVLADNLLLLYVFWELTSVTSYLLIGFDHDRPEARAAALEALLVTVSGGLALLAGFVLLGQAGGTYRLSELLGAGEAIEASGLAVPAALLVLAGAFTKSAQFPFHFWLPSAMEAPTPVSAYLHSATMVKAGVYLLARLSPLLGWTPWWSVPIMMVGGVTAVIAASMALREADLKRILAYSTVSALGAMTLLIGVGTPAAATAAAAFLLAHACYKGALFLVAGIVDHETGTREIGRLGGLRHRLPITTVAAVLAGLSMMGVPPLLGYLGKELVYEAALLAPIGRGWVVAAAFAASVGFVAIAGLVSVRPFFGDRPSHQPAGHEAPAALWLGPLLLGALGLACGLVPGLAGRLVIGPAATASSASPVQTSLALWHGFTAPLGLSALTLALGLVVYLARDRLLAETVVLDRLARLGPASWYRVALGAMNAVARFQTRALQSGYLRVYISVVLLTLVGLVAWTLMGRDLAILRRPAWPRDVGLLETALGGLILAAALVAAVSRSRLGAVAALGVSGYGLALVYLLFGAPDLAMTQVLVETLTVILFVLVFYHLPAFARLSRPAARVRDAIIAVAMGTLVAVLVVEIGQAPHESALAPYFVAQSAPLARGRNIVNVILVDFRALDTLGEITVLGVAGLGVFTLLARRGKGREP